MRVHVALRMCMSMGVRVCACVRVCGRPTVASSGEASSIARASSMLLSTVPT